MSANVTEQPLENGRRRGLTATSTRHASAAARAVTGLQSRYPLAQLVALIALFAYGATAIDGFTEPFSLRSMGVIAALLGLASLGQTIVVLIGGIDLSVAAYIAAGSVLTSELGVAHHWPFALVIVVLVIAAGLAGGATGYLAKRFEVQPLILTLGSSAVVLGALELWLNGQPAGAAPAWLGTLTSPAAQTLGLGIPPLVVIWLIVAILTGIILRYAQVGHWVYATGSNPRAARLALVPTTGVWVGAFATSAVGSAIVGVLLSGFAGGGDLTIGNSYLFETVAAVVVGGTALVGARGDYWRTVLGAVLLTVMNTILVGKGASPAVEQVAIGALILVVVFGYGRSRPHRDRI
jgi:ribose transport system permease protein